MPSIIYNESVYTGPKLRLDKMDATAKALGHHSNYLFLTAVQLAPKDLAEKLQATKELAICERKIAFWKRMHSFDQRRFENEALRMKAEWTRSQR